LQKFKGKVGGFSVSPVDTTGAGDSFVGALLKAVAKDPSIFDVCSLSNTSSYLLR
jgi:fructokinase